MLVCNVSLRPPRAAISATVAEITAAVDATATGNVVFATLVDDPASVGDSLDAYLGEIMLEAATASDSVDGGTGVILSADVAEAASADETADAGLLLTADVAEAVTAATIQDGAITVTWNPADISNMTLSSANLTATASANGGVRTTRSYSSASYYWEVRVSNWAHANTGPGIASSSATLSSVAATPTQAVIAYKSGNIWVNNANSSSTLGARASNDIIGIALDAGSKLIWLRVAPSGNWNGSGTANPATGTGGLSVSALTGAYFGLFASGPAIDVGTINVGGSAFSGSVPAGFTPGLP